MGRMDHDIRCDGLRLALTALRLRSATALNHRKNFASLRLCVRPYDLRRTASRPLRSRREDATVLKPPSTPSILSTSSRVAWARYAANPIFAWMGRMDYNKWTGCMPRLVETRCIASLQTFAIKKVRVLVRRPLVPTVPYVSMVPGLGFRGGAPRQP